LPAFLHNPISAEEAKATLRQRLQEREADFLSVARTAIYPYPSSPYRTLLELAGCEYGDLERLVRLDGVEAALRGLYRQGVYLTVNEFKGRQTAVRGSTTIPVNPTQALNRHSQRQVYAQTSGSRKHRTAVIYDLAHVRERAINILLVLDALDGTDGSTQPGAFLAAASWSTCSTIRRWVLHPFAGFRS
jgi:hypothetical protein